MNSWYLAFLSAIKDDTVNEVHELCFDGKCLIKKIYFQTKFSNLSECKVNSFRQELNSKRQ